MRAQRRLANFLLKSCGLRRLHDGKLVRLARSVFDEIDLQYLRDTHPCPCFENRAQMYEFIQKSCVGDLPIDYLEFGVFRGESLRIWLNLNRNPESRFFGFDSFEGLPEGWRSGQPRGHFDLCGAPPDIQDSRVTFVKGWFENTVPAFARQLTRKNRLILHLDCDLYSSAMVTLLYLTPFMTSGTLLIFDEFYDRENEYKALMDWQKISRKNFRIVAQMANFGKICAELI